MADLDKKEHKNWVLVGCALNIAKNGISPKIQRKWTPGTETSFQALRSNLFHHALVHLVLPNVLLVLHGKRNCHVITWHHDQRYAGTTVTKINGDLRLGRGK